MASRRFLVFIGLLGLHWNFVRTENDCNNPCLCKFLTGESLHLKCNQSETSLLNKTLQNCDQFISPDLNSDSATSLTVDCIHISLQKATFSKLRRITVSSNLKKFPNELVVSNTNLSFLNLSRNFIQVLPSTIANNSTQLKVLDISKNQISILPSSLNLMLTQLYVQQNRISDFSSLRSLSALSVLDISSNPVSFQKSKLDKLRQIKQLHLQAVPALREASFCPTLSSCKILPPRLLFLDLGNNGLYNVPNCSGLLQGLDSLQIFYLNDNHITVIKAHTFQGRCFGNLTVLSLHNNKLISIDSGLTSGFPFLKNLVLSANFLQHLPLPIVKHFHAAHTAMLRTGAKYPVGIFLNDNPWSCDCFQKSLYQYLTSHNISFSLTCRMPKSLNGRELSSLEYSELVCKNASISIDSNLTSAVEYQDGTLVCSSGGIPKAFVSWITPEGNTISLESLSKNPEENHLYGLSGFGENLTVKSVRLSKTGIYRCIANNSISLMDGTVGLSVVLSNMSTIVYLIITCFAFFVAIILNSVNMCMYIHQNIKAKREYKRAVAEVEQEKKLNPPIQQRTRTAVDESVASLNADKHYGKYDYTCQQMFLDTVIKGAHSVKKTLYDARHSEFSTNMWEYAASLRDRLHIELPTQLPTISMPNISMPTIQDINTNIEKLGSSVMTRSHNLASSVGSVFTLKRWMQQQPTNNSSDNDSKSSDENLDKLEVTQVQVDVHSTRLDGKNNLEDAPCTSRQSEQREFRKKLLTNRSETEISDGCSSKSLPNYGRARHSITVIDSPEKIPSKTVTFLPPKSELITVHSTPIKTEVAPVISSVQNVSIAVENQCHSYETSL